MIRRSALLRRRNRPGDWPNIGDLVPTTIVDPNASPKSVSTGNPDLKPTKANNYDLLVEHFFQPLGILQAGFFYKQLSNPIYPTAFTISSGPETGFLHVADRIAIEIGTVRAPKH